MEITKKKFEKYHVPDRGIGIDKVPDRGGGVACSVHVVLDWMVFQWASMAEGPMGV